jgi:hypothetical protein
MMEMKMTKKKATQWMKLIWPLLKGKMARTALMDKDESHKHFLDWASRKENGEMMLLNVVVQIAAF